MKKRRAAAKRPRRKRPAWETLESRVVFEGAASRVRCDLVRGPSGEPSRYVVLDGPPVSLAVPFLEDGRVVLVRQFRYAWRRSSWECPAGHAEPGETPAAACRRELAEETGYRAARLERLFELHASAKTSARFTVFRASRLEPGKARPDPDEELLVRAFSPEEIRKLISRGELVHGPSLAALLHVLPLL